MVVMMMIMVMVIMMMIVVVMVMMMVILRELDRMLIGRSVRRRELVVRIEKFNRVGNWVQELGERTCGSHSSGRGLSAAHQSQRRGAAQQSDDSFVHSMSLLRQR